MPHFFLVLSVNGSGPNSLSGGNDSGKFGNSGVGALALFGGPLPALVHPVPCRADNGASTAV
jgi:hypothetical protein